MNLKYKIFLLSLIALQLFLALSCSEENDNPTALNDVTDTIATTDTSGKDSVHISVDDWPALRQPDFLKKLSPDKISGLSYFDENKCIFDSVKFTRMKVSCKNIICDMRHWSNYRDLRDPTDRNTDTTFMYQDFNYHCIVDFSVSGFYDGYWLYVAEYLGSQAIALKIIPDSLNGFGYTLYVHACDFEYSDFHRMHKNLFVTLENISYDTLGESIIFKISGESLQKAMKRFDYNYYEYAYSEHSWLTMQSQLTKLHPVNNDSEVLVELLR